MSFLTAALIMAMLGCVAIIASFAIFDRSRRGRPILLWLGIGLLLGACVFVVIVAVLFSYPKVFDF
jgi:hypothetical protein